MNIDVSAHACERMKKRRVSEADIFEVLGEFSQTSKPNADGSGTAITATIGSGRKLTVVVAGKRPFPEPIFIITVY